MITFSSDEELVEALGSISGDVFRVFVKGGEPDASNDGKMLYFFHLFVFQLTDRKTKPRAYCRIQLFFLAHSSRMFSIQ